MVYTREPLNRPNAYVKTFKIVDGNGIDGVQGTDGIDVVSFPLGSAFPQGLFVVQDGDNAGSRQNFKLVPWEGVVNAGSPKLTIDTTCDPRIAGDGSSRC